MTTYEEMIALNEEILNIARTTPTEKPYSQTELIRYLEAKRIEDGKLPGTVYAIRPSDPVRPSRGYTVVFEVNNVLLGESGYAPRDINWKTRRPSGILYKA